MGFREFPEPWGHATLRAWDRRANERLCRLLEREGELHNAIQALMSEGYRPREEISEDNMVVDDGFNLLLDLLQGNSTPLSYVALGSSTNAPASTDHALGSEVARIAVSSFTSASNDLTVTGYFLPTQANVSLAEAGIFGGSATSAANSGTLYSRVTFAAFTKDDLESLTAQWDLGFARPS